MQGRSQWGASSLGFGDAVARWQRKIVVVAEEAWWSAREVYSPEWQWRAISFHNWPNNRFPNVRRILTTIRKLRSSCSRGGSHLITSLHPSLSLAWIIINGCVSGPTGPGSPTGKKVCWLVVIRRHAVMGGGGGWGSL